MSGERYRERVRDIQIQFKIWHQIHAYIRKLNVIPPSLVPANSDSVLFGWLKGGVGLCSRGMPLLMFLHLVRHSFDYIKTGALYLPVHLPPDLVVVDHPLAIVGCRCQWHQVTCAPRHGPNRWGESLVWAGQPLIDTSGPPYLLSRRWDVAGHAVACSCIAPVL